MRPVAIAMAIALLFLPPASSGPVTGNAKRGAELFEKQQCSQCHLNGTNLIEPDKPLKGQKFAKKYPTDGQIAALVRKGVAGTGMPSTGKDMLNDHDLSDVIAFIRSLTPPAVPAQTTSSSPLAKAKPGKAKTTTAAANAAATLNQRQHP